MTGLRERKKRRRKGRIYSAALELLNEKGFAQIHMREISERAELAVGTLYNYYPSKFELYMEIMEEKWGEILRSHKRGIIAAVKRERNLHRILEEIFFPVLKDMFGLGLKDWEEIFMVTFSNSQYLQRGARLDREAVELVERLMRKLQSRGVLKRKADPGSAAFALYGIVAFNFLALLFSEEMREDQFFTSVSSQFGLIAEGMGTEESLRLEEDSRR